MMDMKTIDRTSGQKLYCQILEILKRHIEDGDWKVGARIPTEEQLCVQYNVSRATVRMAIEELVLSGHLKRFQGKGTFVRMRDPKKSLAVVTHIGEKDASDIFSSKTRVLERICLPAPEHIRDWLCLSDGDHCLYAMRLTTADCMPLTLQRIYMPYAIIPSASEASSLTDPFHSIIEEICKLKIQRVRELTDISAAGETDRSILGLSHLMQVLRTRRIYYGQGDMPLGYSESFHRTEEHPRQVFFERLKV